MCYSLLVFCKTALDIHKLHMFTRILELFANYFLKSGCINTKDISLNPSPLQIIIMEFIVFYNDDLIHYLACDFHIVLLLLRI